jgi:hypothetical protein
MDIIAAKPREYRENLFRETGIRRGLPAAIMEKDFWVCWTLKHVFNLPMASHLLFKGGTSLSKVFSAINRFSEDIDLSVHRDYLGFGGDSDPMLLPSASKRDAQIAKLQQACIENIQSEFLPALRMSFKAVLGDETKLEPKEAGNPTVIPWNLELAPNDPQTVLFTYPVGIGVSGPEIPRNAYIAPVVKLEMGARSDPYPTGSHTVTSYAAEEYPNLFEEASCTLNVLEAERTFWEKATILHAEYHRPDTGRATERLSRHYYDLAQLAATEIAGKALGDFSLLERVAMHKKVFFRSGWAKYDEARPGSFRLVPPPSRQDALRRDYDSMQEMFFGERPSFEHIIATLQLLEDRINSSLTPRS